MELDHLTDRHVQLQQDLANAYRATSWNAGEIDRLADELAATERQITQRRAFDAVRERQGGPAGAPSSSGP